MATIIDNEWDLSDVDLAVTRCRSYGHAWDEFAPIDLDPPLYGWRLSLRCLRCTSERHDVLDFKGQLMGRRYRYVEGYRQPGLGKIPQPVFREALYERLRADLEKLGAIGEEPPAKKTRRSRRKVAA